MKILREINYIKAILSEKWKHFHGKISTTFLGAKRSFLREINLFRVNLHLKLLISRKKLIFDGKLTNCT